jgi:hypothetical protein
MRSFKFFEDNEEEDELVPINDSASWMWADEFGLREVTGYHWELQSDVSFGIRSFLNMFPSMFIVAVHSISCNGIRHEANTPRDGWGFDITSDLLTIEYYNLIPDDL